MTIDDSNIATRRVPQQPRSQKKVALLLETAMKLFCESGMDQVSMREIARASEMPIATVYQYFPNKQAMIKMIWENYTTAIGELLESQLRIIQKSPEKQSVQRVIDRVVDSIAQYHDRNPAFLEIRRCVEATPDLRKLNYEDTLRVSGLIRDAITAVNPETDPSALKNYSVIATEAASSTIRLGQQMNAKQRRELYHSLKSFLWHFYRSLATP